MSRSGRWTGLASRAPVDGPASSATAVPRAARARGDRGDRLSTGTMRSGGTPKAIRSVTTRTRAWTPLSDGLPDREHDVGPGRGGAGHHVALLHVDRPAAVLALEVGVDVADDHAVGPAQGVEGGLERLRAQRRPEAGPAQPEQQVVAALVDGPGQRRGRRRPRAGPTGGPRPAPGSPGATSRTSWSMASSALRRRSASRTDAGRLAHVVAQAPGPGPWPRWTRPCRPGR